MKKLTSLFLCICYLAASAVAFDLEGALHVDTYAGSPSVGFSFHSQANIAKYLAVRAQADYLSAKTYDVQTLIVGEAIGLTFGGGFALGIKSGSETPIVPGLGLLFGLEVTNNLRIETSGILTFTPTNLGKLYDVKGEVRTLYNTENAQSILGYRIKKGFHTDEFVNSVSFEVDAFEKGFPIGLSLGTAVDFFLSGSDLGLDVSVGGGLSVITGKFGTYFAKAKVGVLSHKEAAGVPFDVAVGAKFNFE